MKFDWDRFEPRCDLTHEYARCPTDENSMLRKVGAYFAECLPKCDSQCHHGDAKVSFTSRRGIDVNAGNNLYPAMAMLPFCDEITLLEPAGINRAWLTRELSDGAMQPWWTEFWSTLRLVDRRYAALPDFRQVLQDRARVCSGNVFALRRESACYDVGTMFSAESIIERHDEFVRAMRTFIQVLRPGAPFAVAFMCRSEGRPLAAYPFPPVSIVEQDVCNCVRFADPGASIDIINDEPVLRPGYEGLLLAMERAGPDRGGEATQGVTGVR